MTELPKGWVLTTLADLSAAEPRAITDGPFGSNLKSSHYTKTGPRVIRLQNIGNGIFKHEDAHISEEHYNKLQAHTVKAGDLVVASLGAELPRACLVPVDVPPAIVKADCIRVRLHEAIDAKYVNFALQRPDLRHMVEDQIHGVGRPRLGMSGIKALPIPLAPSAEQRRIVNAIEEHLTQLDAVRNALSTSLARLSTLRAAALESCISDAWPRFTIEKVAADEQHAVSIGPFGSDLKVSDYAYEGVPLVFIRNIRSEEFNGTSTRYVSVEKAKALSNHWVRKGDVLVTKMGEPPGEATVYPCDDPAVITADCIKITPKADVDAAFLTMMINSSIGRRQVLSITRGVAQRKVSLGRFRTQVEVPVPGADEQATVVAFMEALDQKAEHVRSQVESVSARSVALRRAILAHAFSGRLVRQNPDDEPAEVLLERIRVERDSSPTHRGHKKLVAS